MRQLSQLVFTEVISQARRHHLDGLGQLFRLLAIEVFLWAEMPENYANAMMFHGKQFGGLLRLSWKGNTECASDEQKHSASGAPMHLSPSCLSQKCPLKIASTDR